MRNGITIRKAVVEDIYNWKEENIIEWNMTQEKVYVSPF